MPPEAPLAAPAATGGPGLSGRTATTGGLVKKLFSFPVTLAVGLALVTVVSIASRFDDPDLWFHLKLGQVIWTTHSVPSADTFSFTAQGHTWFAHEWLAELATYAAYLGNGYSGLMFAFAVVVSLLFVMVYLACRQRCGNWLAAFLGGVCAMFFATPALALRPLLLGYLFLVVELILLELAVRNRRWLWLLPPLFALWVNCHGSYFFGIAALGAHWLSSFFQGKWGIAVAEPRDRDDRRTLTIVLLLSVMALCLNPVGVRLLIYPLNVAFSQPVGTSAVEEWMPPDPRSARALAMIAAVIAIPVICAIRREALHMRDLLVLLGALFLSLQHVRMLFVFGIVVSPFVARLIAPALGPDRKRDSPVANVLFIGALLFAIVRAFPAPAALERQVSKGSPVAAVDYIHRARLAGPMLNEYVFGDYLIWALPEEKVFIDGRGDIYDWTGVFPAYGRWATLQEDPRLLLDRYHIQFCLLAKDAPMTHVLPYLGWRKTYSDDIAAIFER